MKDQKHQATVLKLTNRLKQHPNNYILSTQCLPGTCHFIYIQEGMDKYLGIKLIKHANIYLEK